MKTTYPRTIENCIGEKIVFQKVQPEADGDRLILENFVTPGHGPVMHTHWLQDEELTVVEGKLGYQTLGQEARYANEGETVLFKRGTPHRFWNAGQEILHCQGWVKPVHTLEFFLSALYDAQNRSGQAQPEMFDGAYLMTRYSQEYDLPEIPQFVKKVIIPATYLVGRALGKYKKFENAPEPVTGN